MTSPKTPIRKSLSVLIHDLDGVFSRYIRLRDMKDGVIKCFICGKKMTFAEAQCAHWIERDKMPTRYDEINCHSCCESCNVYDAEHVEKYGYKMMATYGLEVITGLIRKSRGLQKYLRHELEDLIEHYTRESAILKKQR